jgi:hypothetical protein
MIVNLLSWIYISFLSYCFSGIALDGLSVTTKKQIRCDCFPLRGLLGISIISFLLSGLSILFPISLSLNVVFFIISVFYFIMTWKRQKKGINQYFRKISNLDTYFLAGVLLISLLLLFQSSVGPFNYDTGLYHAQAINWNNFYPAIPGLGNLHGRFAFNPLIFLDFSLFDFHFLFAHPLHSLNGWLLLMCLWFSFDGLNRLLQGERTYDVFFQALISVPLVGLIYDSNRFSVEVSSFSSDMPVSALVLVITSLAVIYKSSIVSDKNLCQKSSLVIIILTLSLFSVMTKISALSILLISGHVIYEEIRQDRKRYIPYIVFMSMLAGLFHVTRNLILSGYFIYPLAITGWISSDWKIPVDLVFQEKNMITTWARVPDSRFQLLASGDFSDWFFIWFGEFIRQWEAWVLIASIFFLMLVFLILPRAVWQKILSYKFLWLTLIFSLILWWMSAPDIRFDYGFIMALTILGLATILYVLYTESRIAFNSKSFVYVFISLNLLISVWNFNFFLDDIQFFLSPMPFPWVSTTLSPLEGVDLFVPAEGDQCWLSAFPCTPYIQPGLTLRGEDISSGFKILQK